LLCSDYDTQWAAEVIHVEGNFYWSTFIEKNPIYDHFFRTYFRNGQVGQQLLHVLFHPHPEVLQAKNKWLQNHGIFNHDVLNNTSKYLITFQLRNDDINNHPQISQEEYETYKSCSINNIPHTIEKDNIIWFAATDTLKSREVTTMSMNDRNITYYKDEFLTGGSVEGLRMALVDILIAAEGKQIFVSPWSSYGRMIALYNTDSPIYMVSDNVLPKADVHRVFTSMEKHCYRLLSREECPWFESSSTYSKIIEGMKCYKPSMKLDFC
jgi:hypothetical protein